MIPGITNSCGNLSTAASGACSCTPAYDSGDRTASITVTTTLSLGGGSIASNLVDGGSAANATDAAWWDATAGVIVFNFGAAVKITETTWTFNNTGNNGSFTWEGSSDGSSYSTIGSGAKSLSGSTTYTDTTLSANSAGYQYYRANFSTGGGATNWCQEVTFKRCTC